MKKIKLAILLTFAFSKLIFSQSDFRKGFVITQDNDTLYGLVNYRESIKKYKVCEFKVSEDQEVKNYFPEDIKAYRFINDKYFVTKEITLENNVKEKVFFEVLVQGKVTLYKYLESFFIEKDGGEYIKLTNERVLVTIGDAEYYKNSNKYIGVLSYLLLSDCKQLKKKINSLEYKERGLTELIQSYNACMEGSSISFKENKSWLKTEFGLVAGINSSKISFKSKDPNQEFITKDFDRSNNIMPGLFIDFYSPRVNERIAFHTGLFYLHSTYISYSEITKVSSLERNDVKIDLKQLKIPFGVKYTFPEKKFTPFFDLGASYTNNLEASSWRIREVQRYNIIDTFEGEALDMRESQYGLWGGIGVKRSIIKKWAVFVELRYEYSSGTSISSSYYDKDRISNIQLLIGISY